MIVTVLKHQVWTGKGDHLLNYHNNNEIKQKIDWKRKKYNK